LSIDELATVACPKAAPVKQTKHNANNVVFMVFISDSRGIYWSALAHEHPCYGGSVPPKLPAQHSPLTISKPHTKSRILGSSLSRSGGYYGAIVCTIMEDARLESLAGHRVLRLLCSSRKEPSRCCVAHAVSPLGESGHPPLDLGHPPMNVGHWRRA